MVTSSWLSNEWLRIVVLAFAATVLVLMPSPLPTYLTTFDFQAYWGASRLLSQSDNFTDPALLLELEQATTGFDQDAPLFARNLPWFLAWFLPLVVIGFERASWVWFLINIVLVFSRTVMLWHVFATRTRTISRLWGWSDSLVSVCADAYNTVGRSDRRLGAVWHRGPPVL